MAVPNIPGTPIWTYHLTSTKGDSNTGIITISKESGLKAISIKGKTSAATTVTGNVALTRNGLSSEALSLVNDEVLDIASYNNEPLDGIIINCVANTAECDIVGQL